MSLSQDIQLGTDYRKFKREKEAERHYSAANPQDGVPYDVQVPTLKTCPVQWSLDQQRRNIQDDHYSTRHPNRRRTITDSSEFQAFASMRKTEAESKKFPYDSRQIANWFIRHSEGDGRPLSIMQVLKLVYMAHGWCLGALDRPLVIDRIEAWDYGPVIPAVYYAFRPQGVYGLSPLPMHEAPLEGNIKKLLEEVYDLYKGKSASRLSTLTHVRGGPWDKTYGRGNMFSEIPNDLIADHYKEKLKRAENGRHSA